MARRKKKKVSVKTLAIGAAVLLGLGAVAGGSGDKTPAPSPTPEPVRTVATAAPTARPRPTARPDLIHGMEPERTVYVSGKNVIHLEKDCSGMKHYREMTLKDADAAGYEYCSKCVW